MKDDTDNSNQLRRNISSNSIFRDCYGDFYDRKEYRDQISDISKLFNVDDVVQPEDHTKYLFLPKNDQNPTKITTYGIKTCIAVVIESQNYHGMVHYLGSYGYDFSKDTLGKLVEKFREKNIDINNLKVTLVHNSACTNGSYGQKELKGIPTYIKTNDDHEFGFNNLVKNLYKEGITRCCNIFTLIDKRYITGGSIRSGLIVTSTNGKIKTMEGLFLRSDESREKYILRFAEQNNLPIETKIITEIKRARNGDLILDHQSAIEEQNVNKSTEKKYIKKNKLLCCFRR